MPHDDTLIHLLKRSAMSATGEIVAPESWAENIPVQAARRRRRIGLATGTAAMLATTGIAAAVALPLTRSENPPAHTSAARLAGFAFAPITPESRAAARQLSCLTAAPPTPRGSTSVLSVGSTDADGSACDLLRGRRDATLPSDARPLAGHGHDLYLGAETSGYRLAYRIFTSADVEPLVLQIAVAGTVSTRNVLAILDTVTLAPSSR